MILEIYTKNHALVQTLEIETTFVPRVGEVIESVPQMDDVQDAATLLVHDVRYILRDGKLTPLVECHAASPEHHRRLLLEENGWL